MKMDETALVETIQQLESQALGWQTGDLAADRARSIDAYLSKPYGNEVEGRSQVVTSDVSDAIEGVMPSLIRVFTSGDDICQFEPFGPEDEEQAKQETDYINYVLTQQNRFLPILQTWLRDGLIGKVGYVKAIWDDSEDIEEEEYEGLSEIELVTILSDPEVEVIGQEVEEDGSIEIKVKRKMGYGQIRIFNCPFEEVLVNEDHAEVSLRNAKFVQHRPQMTISEIRQMGYDIPDDISDTDDQEMYPEWMARNRFSEEWDNNPGNDPSLRVVTFKETYMLVDYDGDGIVERRKICMVGNTVLENEKCGSVPICAWTPLIMPHRHVGRSMAEMVEDIQKTKTGILRGGMDSIYLALNPRNVTSDKVVLDDLLVSRPGGVVRLQPGAMPGEGHVMPLISPDVSGTAFPMLQYFDGVREIRTGVMRMGAGLQSDSINKLNSTATGASLMASSAQGRQELIARTFAETGLRDLMLLCHELTRKHNTKEQVIKLRNRWVPVNPRTWRTRYDMTISVGLGTGNREQQMANITNMLMAQKEAFHIGVATPENIYNSLTKLAEAAGFKAPEQFFTNPTMAPQKPPQPDPKMIEAQGKMQIEQAKMQSDQQKAQADFAIKQNEAAQRMEIEKAKLELESMKMNMQIQIEQMKAQAQIELEREKLAMQAQLEAGKQNFARETEMMKATDMLLPLKQAIDQLQAQIMGMQVIGIKPIRDEAGNLVGGVRVLADGTETQITLQ